MRDGRRTVERKGEEEGEPRARSRRKAQERVAWAFGRRAGEGRSRAMWHLRRLSVGGRQDGTSREVVGGRPAMCMMGGRHARWWWHRQP